VTLVRRQYFEKSRGLMGDQYWEFMKDSGRDPEILSLYLRGMAEALLRMSDDALRLYAEEAGGRAYSPEELEQWREQLREVVGA
jgi:chromosome segregation ATPase